MNENPYNQEACGYKCGSLPPCAPLAVGFVPGQTAADPRYTPEKALTRGTLFPGLDLPLGNIVNRDTADTPLTELTAVEFAAHELSLYLDTHADDAEAFAVYRDLLQLSEEGRERYVRLYGPLCKTDLAKAERYTWLNGPWPWELSGNREG